MTEVHDFLEMRQGSQNLRATQKESHAQNKQMTAVGYISDTEDIINASWSNFQHDGAAGYELSERLPLQPALSAKNLPGGRTQVFIVHLIKSIAPHPAESDEDSAPRCISDTENWLPWNGDVDSQNREQWQLEGRRECNLERVKDIEALESPVHRDVHPAPNVPRLIRPIRWSMKPAEMGLITVTTTERRNEIIKNMQDRMGQYVITRFYMLLDWEFHLERYLRRILSSHMWIFVHTQKYGGWIESFSKMFQFGRMWVTLATRLLGSTLPMGWVSSWLKGNQ